MAKVTSGQVGEYIKIAAYLGAGYLAYKAIKGLAETFGLIKTEAEDKLDTSTDVASGDASILIDNPLIAFNGNYATAIIIAFNKKFGRGKFNATFQNFVGTKTLPELSRKLWESSHFFNDDEEAVYGIFRSLRSQYQLSILSSLFFHAYGKDLLEYLKKFLDANEMEKIIDIVKNYPKYIQP